MKSYIKQLLREGLGDDTLKIAYDKIDELPVFRFSRDLKEIGGVFKISKHTYKELRKDLEDTLIMSKENFMYVDVMDIHISQLFIEGDKVKGIINNIDKSPILNVFQFSDGEKVIYDGHHRLVAHWALGEKRIKVNLTPQIW
jgi:hypothetical protein